ncbi:amidase signature enzyme [Polyporus arcularius HHB13444]|uniref:Amidase signature enzyme n=1 Tax=Polyporus arcularius HHB13444 TaxID=1314778 RepID=A0A5C3PPX1_9APHY|nr:amidase signature enzyme [Polyporus arcularius HHB13444]
MFSFFSAHRRDCLRKQEELRAKLSTLPAVYYSPSAEADAKILALSLSQIVDACEDGSLAPTRVLEAYGKRCVAAHEATNCLADVFFEEAERSAAAPLSSQRPLHGVPVTVKDCIDVAGHDTTGGYSSRVGQPAVQSAPIVRLLRDAGGLVYAKTTLPTGCLSFEVSSDIFGTTTNPYNAAFSPGASTGGGAALLACQGSMVEVGTDIGGSTRYPAAYCGLYSVKGSHGRFPSHGSVSCLPGLEAVPTITAPIARTLDDLEEFWKRVVEMKPWEYDHTCVPLPWKNADFVSSGQRLKFGLIMDDGVVPPTPANTRALLEVASALAKQGHEVVPFYPPSPLEGLKIGYQLMFSEGAASVMAPLRAGEHISPAVRTVRTILRLPLWLKKLHAKLLRWLSRPLGRNDAWASLLEVFHPKSALEERRLVVEREAYRATWHEAWNREGLDFVLTVPHALPAVPTDPKASDRATLVSANYAFLYNVLDYSAGVLPVGYVDRARDSYDPDFREGAKYRAMNDVARAVHDVYDADSMHGMPLAVQIVGRRFEEEKVLAGMKVAEKALWTSGKGFVPRQF